MAQAAFTFPRGFKWGTATAAYQVEGNNTNSDWWAWEQQPGRIYQEQKSGLACDWWGGRWREDFDRAAEAGQNAHRLSVEWSRIEPRPGVWDEAALDHYRQMLRGLRERGMEPMVTLHHFSNPIWLADQGGWEGEAIVSLFERFVRKTVPSLAEYCDLWCTLNEPNVFAYFGYSSGEFPPGKRDTLLAFRVMRNQIRAHAAAYHAIHELQPGARVGIAILYRGLVEARAGLPLDVWVARLQSFVFNEVIPLALHDGRVRFPVGREAIPAAARTQDFLGINYYTEDHVWFDLRKAQDLFGRRGYPKGAALSENGWLALYPEGLFRALKWGRHFGVPLMVTENGCDSVAGSQEDTYRLTVLATHLRQVWRAVNFNWPVLGYYHWTLVDNFEWNYGWKHRFGLWELDTETQARSARPSARMYADICRASRLSSDMVENYLPSLAGELFPG